MSESNPVGISDLTLAELEQACVIARRYGLVKLVFRGAELHLIPEILETTDEEGKKTTAKTPLTHPDEPEVWD